MSDIKATTIEATTSDSPAKVTVRLNGNTGNARTGGNGHDGDLVVFGKDITGNDLDDAAKANIHLDGSTGHIRLGGTMSSSGELTLQGSGPFAPFAMGIGGSEAEITLRPNLSENVSIHLKGDSGSLHLRSVIPVDKPVVPASLVLFDGNGKNHLQLDAETGDITMRARLANDNKTQSGADLKLIDGHGVQQIHLDGRTGNISLNGDIFLNGADCAEDFAMTGTADAGTVVVIRDEEILAPSDEAYDKKVAGVIAGAGSYRPAIILNRGHAAQEHRPVSLIGRAYCKVDADYSAIEAGDLLTTSATPGHAMKASDPQRAFGAVIGKALRPLREGRGVIPILIAMQ